MTAEEALALLEPILESHYLSQTQKVIFQKVWEGQSYVQIAVEVGYDHGYIKDTGAQLWRLLSKVLGKKVTKNNVRNVMAGLSQQSIAPLSSNNLIPVPANQSWGEAVDISTFYGREAEQACLETWVVGDRCRLVALLGIGGVGKTALSIQLAQHVQAQFDYVVWRSLRLAPPLVDLLPEIILALSEQQDAQVPNTAPKQIEHLLTYLRQRRCLLVLDNLESSLLSGERAGSYRSGYEDYGYLLERIADTTHQSCLLFTSREQPRGMAQREGEGSVVRSLSLTGLDQTASQALIHRAGLANLESQQARLVQRYSGNPLALKIVAATIRSVFGGDVTEFLDYGTVVFGDLWDLLDQQFSRLSAIEQTVMRWLAINREWTTLKELRADIMPPVSHRALLEAVESLKARSLVETSPAGITQQPVVMEYMTERLVTQFYAEINQRDFDLFSQLALLKADAKEFVREAQMRQLSRTLLERLLGEGQERSAIEQKLRQLLSWLRHQPANDVGYAGGNLLNLLCQLGADLQGQDLSHLTLWQAYLSGQNLQNVNLAHTDLSRSVFSESLASITTVAFSPDGQWLVAGDTNGEIHIWQVADGHKHLFWKAHTGWIWSVAFSPDGTKLASCSEDRAVNVWEIETGQRLNQFAGNRNRIWSVAWHPEGQWLTSGGENYTVQIWDVVTNQCVRRLQVQHKTVEPVAFSPDGRVLACASSIDPIIALWDCQNGECISQLSGHANGIWSLCFSPDHQTLISSSVDTTVRVWDWTTGDCLQVLQGHQESIWSVATNQQGTLIASSSEDHTVRIWDAQTGQCLRTLQGFKSRIWSIAFNAQAPLLASGDDEAVKLWSMQTGQCLKTFRGCPQVNWSVTFMANSSHLASGGQDQWVRIWDWETGSCLQTLKGHPGYVYAISHHPMEPIIASTSVNTAYVWDVATSRLMTVLAGHAGQIWQVAFSPDGQRLATCSFDHTVKVWDWRSGACLNTLRGHHSWTYCISFSPDGRWLATGSMDQTVKLWDAQTGECFKTLATDADWITDLVFSPDSQIIITGSSLGVLIRWRMDTDTPLQTAQGHAGHISGVSFAPDGKTFVSSSHDHTIKLWDAATFECLKTLAGHANMVAAVAFSADGRRVASASHDETVRVWDIGTGQCLKVLRAPRPYEGMNIQGVSGLTNAQRSTLQILGAV